MAHPCEHSRYEEYCVVQATVCRQMIFDIAAGVDPVECPAKVPVYYHGIEGVFA